MITKKEQEANELKISTRQLASPAPWLCPRVLSLVVPDVCVRFPGRWHPPSARDEFVPYARRLHYSVDRPGQVYWPVFDKMLEKRANSIRDDLKNAEEAPGKRARAC